MFHLETDASKLALAALVAHVKERGFHMIDCQMTTSHLLSLGAEEICREKYLEMLKLALE